MTSFDALIIENPQNAEAMIFGSRIAYAIEKNGLSKAWIADRLGISKQALNYLLKHATKPKFVDELAEILNLNPEWVEKGVGTPRARHKIISSQINKIPLLTKDILLKKTKDSWREQNTVEFSNANTENFIAYPLDDNSNFPPFIQGSILIFDITKQPKNEDYVLLIIENEAMVRQYLVDGNNICYKASDVGHKTFINPNAELMGVLVEARYQIS